MEKQGMQQGMIKGSKSCMAPAKTLNRIGVQNSMSSYDGVILCPTQIKSLCDTLGKRVYGLGMQSVVCPLVCNACLMPTKSGSCLPTTFKQQNFVFQMKYTSLLSWYYHFGVQMFLGNLKCMNPHTFIKFINVTHVIFIAMLGLQ